jgi:hypothetical protein
VLARVVRIPPLAQAQVSECEETIEIEAKLNIERKARKIQNVIFTKKQNIFRNVEIN